MNIGEFKKLVVEFSTLIVEMAGVDTPWHISRFYPQYKHLDAEATSAETLERAYKAGKRAGLRYIYVGNLPGSGHQSTFCYKCDSLLIERAGYRIISNSLSDGCCPDCGVWIAGVF